MDTKSARKWISLCLALVAVAALGAAPAGAQEDEGLARLLRYPDVHGDHIAFVYAGDIWVVGTEGGTARRLTSHEGLELFPKFSPDGRWIAFSGEYGGNRQVFVISVDGGTPKQLTFYNDIGPLPPRGGVDYRVLDWTPDGEKVLFLANRVATGERRSRPYLVPAAGGMEEPLAVPEGGGGMLSPDGTKLVYTPYNREFRTWKRYHGGQAQDVWIYDLAVSSATRLTDYDGTDNQPMWVGDSVYFTSDRGGKLNLWATSPEGGEARQVTFHDRYDALWPSAGPESIVYQNGGYIYRYDPAAGESTRVPVRVYGDFAGTLPHLKNVEDFIEGGQISPSGKRAVFTARGEVFTVPAEEGQVRNLTASQGVRELDATWSPDGSWIAYQSDRTGEYEIYLRAQDGSGGERQVTHGSDIWRFPPAWSPDSGKLAFGDKHQWLRYLDVESGEIVDVDHGTDNDITTYSWSPDSRWIAYVKASSNLHPAIWVYSLEEGETYQLTGDDSAEFNPVWDPEGRYLYFVSARDFNLAFSDFEFDFVYNHSLRVYVGVLAEDGPALFRPASDEEPAGGDEVGNGKNGKGEDGNGGNGDDDGEVRVEIDPEGFAGRVRAIPGDSGNYQGLTATSGAVLYLTGDGPVPSLKRYLLEDEKEESILDGVTSYSLSADGTKILYNSRGKWGIANLGPGIDADAGALDLSGMTVKLDPRAEWAQMFTDAWRNLRDWFYDPDLHGVDWNDVRQRYGEMLPWVAHRADLDFLLGEMGAELEAGHVYVQPGDQPGVERVESGLLGAEISADPSGAFRVDKVFPGENWHEDYRSPLTEPGVDVAAGSFILAVDGRPTSEVDNFYQLLEGKGDQVVTLTVNDRPSTDGAREVRVKTITHETNVRYLDWIQTRREMADRLSGGRIGYIHLPDTAVDGNRELFKGFYPQFNKDALILDARYNGGGFIPYKMVRLLDRPVLSYWAQRGLSPVTTPVFAHQGPKATLINGYAGSGGDAFPYYFRKLGLGPLIGTRTWGGLIGISGNPGLADGGLVTAPTFRFFDTEGNFVVEGTGVVPDIEVIDRPDLVAQGRDPSLEKAVEVLLEELERNPPPEVEAPAPPKHY